MLRNAAVKIMERAGYNDDVNVMFFFSLNSLSNCHNSVSTANRIHEKNNRFGENCSSSCEKGKFNRY